MLGIKAFKPSPFLYFFFTNSIYGFDTMDTVTKPFVKEFFDEEHIEMDSRNRGHLIRASIGVGTGV